MSSHPCPLCSSTNTQDFHQRENKIYWRCGECQLRFLDTKDHPSAELELAHYNLHENIPDDPGYRKFLARLADPLITRLKSNHSKLIGLDYGCGPGPALARMLEDEGYEMAIYDPFYFPNNSVFNRQYNFITCTETVEHFHTPAIEFEKFDALLKPAGLLAIMTIFQDDDAKFANWHYRRDPTHVAFYRRETFAFLASKYNWTMEIPRENVVMCTKN